MDNFSGKKFHFIAAGGVGMSALAKYLIERGAIVSGSDISNSKYLEHLRELGAKVTVGHYAQNIEKDMTVVVSSAIKENNPEYIAAKKLGLNILHRSDLLQKISQEFSDRKESIFFGFSGTHGKTTTSGLCSYILTEGGYAPSYAVGGTIINLEENSRYASDKYFVAELDESDGTIVKYKPDINVINNLSYDHPDFYKNGIEDIYKTFAQFTNNLSDTAKTILNADCPNTEEFKKYIPNANIITFGIENGDYRAENIVNQGLSSKFDITFNGKYLCTTEINLPGIHNIYNVLSVFTALKEAGLEVEKLSKYFSSFSGMGRRFQFCAEFNGIKVYDDYAHHPEEIQTTLEGAKAGGKITAIFQPHRYSRLQGLWSDFLNAFDYADRVFVLDVYSASESPIQNITSENFARELAKKHSNCEYISGNIKEAAEKIYEKLKSGDIVITLGAGDITKLGKELKNLNENYSTIQ